MNGVWATLIVLLSIAIPAALFVWMMFCIMAHVDGENDAENNNWKADHRGRLTRWAYLLGRRTGPRKALNKARRAKLNEQKRSRKAEAKAFGS